MNSIISDITRENIINLINNKERIDGRSPNEYRDISLEIGVIGKAEGSARVKIGNTQILIGAKPQIAEPFPDSPSLGILMTNSELLPMASPTFEPGPPDERSVELARVVDRCIREGKVVDLEKLCIVEGEKVWMIFLDIHVLDHDGNLIDASVLGSVASLIDAKIPHASHEDGKIILDYENMGPLPINEKALMCTFAKIGDEFVVDPSVEEERVMDARISIGMREDGTLCAMQKGGAGSLTKDELIKVVGIAKDKTRELREYLG